VSPEQLHGPEDEPLDEERSVVVTGANVRTVVALVVGIVVATACMIVRATVVVGADVVKVVEVCRVVCSVPEATEALPSVARDVEAQQQPAAAIDRRRTTRTAPIMNPLGLFILDDQR